MNQVTAQPPSELNKASEEVTGSSKSKWGKRLLMLGLATGLVAAGAYQWGMFKTLGALMATDLVHILGEAGWGELKKRYGKKSVAEKEAEYDRLCEKGYRKAFFWGAALVSSCVFLVSGDRTGAFVKGMGLRDVVAQARSGVVKPRTCQLVMGWDIPDFLPHRREVCVAASVERDGHFTLITPCREKQDGSCEPLSSTPVIYRGNKLISNGGMSL